MGGDTMNPMDFEYHPGSGPTRLDFLTLAQLAHHELSQLHAIVTFHDLCECGPRRMCSTAALIHTLRDIIVKQTGKEPT
jgi:hypothetical protein